MNIQTRTPLILKDGAPNTAPGVDTVGKAAVELAEAGESNILDEGQLLLFDQDKQAIDYINTNDAETILFSQKEAYIGFHSNNFYNPLTKFKPSEIIDVHKIVGTDGQVGECVFDVSDVLPPDLADIEVGDTVQIHVQPDYANRLKRDSFEPFMVSVSVTPSNRSEFNSDASVVAKLLEEYDRIKSRTSGIWYKMEEVVGEASQVKVTSHTKDITPRGSIKFFDRNDEQNFNAVGPKSVIESVPERGTYKQLHTDQNNIQKELRMSMDDSNHNTIWNYDESTIVFAFDSSKIYDRYDIVVKATLDFIKHEEPDPSTVFAFTAFVPDDGNKTHAFLEALHDKFNS